VGAVGIEVSKGTVELRNLKILEFPNEEDEAFRRGAVLADTPGLQMPTLLEEVKPHYTAEAMSAMIKGSVLLECIVLKDGTVGRVRIVRSLDPGWMRWPSARRGGGASTPACLPASPWRFS